MVRLRSLLPLAIASMALSGCLQTSVHPFVEESEAIEVPGIDGLWVEAGDNDDRETLEILRQDKGHLRTARFRESDKPESSDFVLAFARVGETLIWDMSAEPPEDGLQAIHMLPLHSLARVRLEGDRLEVSFLDPGWVGRRCLSGELDLRYLRAEDDDDAVVLGASTQELRQFVEDVIDSDEAFASDPEVYVRRSRANGLGGQE